MNWILPALLGSLAGIGVFLFIWELTPSSPDLGRAIERLDGTTYVEEIHEEQSSLSSQLGIWMQRRLQGRAIPGLRATPQDLAILGKPRHILLGEKTLGALVGLLLVPLIYSSLLLLGYSIPFTIPAVASLALGVGGWLVPDMLARDQAKEAREDFARSASAFLDLLSIGRISGMMANEAMVTSAQISQNWAFRRLASSLNRARWAGIRTWDALEELEEEIGVPEVGDIGDIVRLSGEGGAQIYETLRGRAKAMRSAQLSHEHALANKQSERMTVPMTLTSIIMLIAVAYPMFSQLIASSAG